MPTSSDPSLAELAEFAVDLAWQAGRRTLAYFQAGVAAEEKDDGTPVTLADREAERVLRQGVRARFPGDSLVGEEYGDELTGGSRTWVFDPIDGTKGFVHGVPLYSVLVAMVEDGRPKIGVIHMPALGETVYAFEGGGCWWNGRRARVSRVSKVAESLVLSSDFPGHEQPKNVDPLYEKARLRRTWGDAYGYAMVATGRAEVMVDPVVAPWDVAALPPILAEAGGRFSTFDGRPDYDAGSAVGSNGLVHDEVLALLRGS